MLRPRCKLFDRHVVGEWLAREDAIRILMSQAESARRLDSGGASSLTQSWEVSTPIDFPGMVVRSETPINVVVEDATPQLSVSSGAARAHASRLSITLVRLLPLRG